MSQRLLKITPTSNFSKVDGFEVSKIDSKLFGLVFAGWLDNGADYVDVLTRQVKIPFDIYVVTDTDVNISIIRKALSSNMVDDFRAAYTESISGNRNCIPLNDIYKAISIYGHSLGGAKISSFIDDYEKCVYLSAPAVTGTALKKFSKYDIVFHHSKDFTTKLFQSLTNIYSYALTGVDYPPQMYKVDFPSRDYEAGMKDFAKWFNSVDVTTMSSDVFVTVAKESLRMLKSIGDSFTSNLKDVFYSIHRQMKIVGLTYWALSLGSEIK